MQKTDSECISNGMVIEEAAVELEYELRVDAVQRQPVAPRVEEQARERKQPLLGGPEPFKRRSIADFKNST